MEKGNPIPRSPTDSWTQFPFLELKIISLGLARPYGEKILSSFHKRDSLRILNISKRYSMVTAMYGQFTHFAGRGHPLA